MTKKTFILGTLCFVATLVLSVFVNFVARFPGQIGEPYEVRAVQLREIVSTAASVNIDGLVLDLNSEPKTAAIRLKNNSKSPIVAYSFESGNFIDSDGSSRVGGPTAIVGANEEFLAPIDFRSFSTGMPIRLSAVVFADGSAEGEDYAKADLLRAVEENNKANASRELFHF